MQYRTLGRTGIQVSAYSLGAMMFGPIGNPDHDDAIAMIHKALDAGINFVDMADRYSAPSSTAGSNPRCCPSPSATAWAPWSGARWPKGLLTGRIRKGQESDLRRTQIFSSFSDAQRLDAVEQIIPLAEQAGLPLTHLAMASAIAHPGVTSAIIGPRTHAQTRRSPRSVDVTLSDDILDRIDVIVAPTLTSAHRINPRICRPP